MSGRSKNDPEREGQAETLDDLTPQNPMDIELEGTPLSVLFSRAAKLKGSQMAPLRSKFDSYPMFYQNTIYPLPEVEDVRGPSKTFEERMRAAKMFKEAGNKLFGDGDNNGAMRQYEMAAAVFRYLENSNPNWKNEGIKDDFVTERFFSAQTPSDDQDVTTFLASCYTNIALACLRMGDYRVALDACNEALALEACSSKALFLRARARLEPKSAGAVEQEQALKDLERAVTADPKNKTAIKELRMLRESTRLQRQRDKATFRGMFDRGEVYQGDNGRGRKEGSASQSNTTYTISETLALAELCAKRGMKEEEKALRELAKDGTSASRKKVNFRNPTEKMSEEAKLMGVDLKDPRVVEMLEKLQAESNGTGEDDDAIPRHNLQGSNRMENSRMIRFFFSSFGPWKRCFKSSNVRLYVKALFLVAFIRLGAKILFFVFKTKLV